MGDCACFSVNCDTNDGGDDDDCPRIISATGKSVYAKESECAKTVFFNLIVPGKGEKINPKKEFKCFDTLRPAELTIYIEQATPGTRVINGENSVGHVFIGIKQNGITRVFGYYPDSGNTLAVGLGVKYDAILRDNSGHNYNVKASKNITGNELKSIIDGVKNFNDTYDLTRKIH